MSTIYRNLDFGLGEDINMLRDTVHAFVDYADDWQHARTVSQRRWRRICQAAMQRAPAIF